VTDKIAFRVGWVSDVGKVRAVNEDSVLTKTDVGLWVVSDGMGGHGAGDLASQAVVEALSDLAPHASASSLLAEFERRIIAANAKLRALAAAQNRPVVGATIVALLVHSKHYACVWCGDSRAYLSRAGALRQITRDHSEVQGLVDLGVISKEEARSWPGRNVINRAIGAADQAGLEIVDGPISDGDRFLLCSDGLTGPLTDDEIGAALAATPDPQKACDDLLRLTLERGADDNVSIVVVDCARTEEAPGAPA